MQDNSTAMTPTSNYRLPENATMQHVTKLSIIDDKPIMMDYWTSSIEKESLIGVKDTQEKLLRMSTPVLSQRSLNLGRNSLS